MTPRSERAVGTIVMILAYPVMIASLVLYLVAGAFTCLTYVFMFLSRFLAERAWNHVEVASKYREDIAEAAKGAKL